MTLKRAAEETMSASSIQAVKTLKYVSVQEEVKIMGSAIKAGASSVAITPYMPVYLAGLDRKPTECQLSRGVHDDIYAKCLLLRVGERQIGFLTLDLIGFFHDDVEDFRKLAHIRKLEPEGIIISSTHQHSGPDTLGLWGPDQAISGVNPEYMGFLKACMVDTLAEAARKLRPVRLRLSKARMPKYVAKNARDPNLIDDEMTILSVENAEGSNVAIVVNFGLHPEVLWDDNNLITADFPCYMYRIVESELGGLCIFVNGALGGMVTPCVSEHSFDEAERIGSTLGEVIIKSMEKAETLDETELTLLTDKVQLPMENENFRSLSSLGVIRRKLVDEFVETEVTVAAIDDASFTTIPGEPLPKVGLTAKSLMPGRFRFLISLGHDELGYIIHPEDWTPQLYEESMSLGPKTATILLKKLQHMLGPI